MPTLLAVIVVIIAIAIVGSLLASLVLAVTEVQVSRARLAAVTGPLTRFRGQTAGRLTTTRRGRSRAPGTILPGEWTPVSDANGDTDTEPAEASADTATADNDSTAADHDVASAEQPQPESTPPLGAMITVAAPAATAASNAAASDDHGRTIVVDASGQDGSYKTVSAGIEAAGAGDRVLVRPGQYHESLVVGKAIELLGDGNLGDAVITAERAPVVRIEHADARLANLRLQQVNGKESWCVGVTGGSLDMEGCDVSSEMGTGIRVAEGSRLRLVGSHLHDSSLAVFLDESSEAFLDQNDISADWIGVHVKGGSDATLRRNVIHDCSLPGIKIEGPGTRRIEGNELAAGVMVSDGGDVVLRGNHLTQGLIQFLGQSGGLVEDNEIGGTVLPLLKIEGGANPTVRHNRFQGGKRAMADYGAGITVDRDGRGVIEDNEFSGMDGPAIESRDGGNPTVRANTIHDNASGIQIVSGGQGEFEANEVTACRGIALLIEGDSHATLRRNHVHDNAHTGIGIKDGGSGLLEANEIVGNAKAGVGIQAANNPILRGNRITGNNIAGIAVVDATTATLEDNDLRGNNGDALYLPPEAQSLVQQRGNRV